MILTGAATFSPNLVKDIAAMLATDFMTRAFLAGGSVAMAAGLVGYFVILRNQVFTSDALGHMAFAGGLGGVLAGIPLVAAVFGSTIGGSVAVGALGGRGRTRDVAIGMVFAWVLGLGVLFLSIYATSARGASGTLGVSVLFGSMLSLQPQQAAVATVAGIATSAALVVIARPLLFASIDPDVASARAIRVRAITVAFMILLGLTVAEAVQAVGALLIFGLLVTPAAIAQDITASPYTGLVLSSILAVAFVWAGTAIAFYVALPASFFIIAISFGAYAVSSTARRLGSSPPRPT